MKGLDRYEEIEKTINPDGTNTDGVIEKDSALSILETVGRRKWDSKNGASDSNTITVFLSSVFVNIIAVVFALEAAKLGVGMAGSQKLEFSNRRKITSHGQIHAELP